MGLAIGASCLAHEANEHIAVASVGGSLFAPAAEHLATQLVERRHEIRPRTHKALV
jgi:hypothetical protein